MPVPRIGDCVNACLAEGALQLVDKEETTLAHVTPALCLGCGACVAVCPEQAIDIDGWTLGQYEAMVDRFVAL